MRMRGLRKKLYRAVYDKPGLDRLARQLRRSLDEIRKLLGEGKQR